MKDEHADLEEQIKRCRRLRNYLTDDEMRDSLEELAEQYEERLKGRDAPGEGFLLRARR
jgi:hypothetical protein